MPGIATADGWYETRTLDDGVSWIFEPHIKPFYRCNIWHVRGRDRDALIDSGMGVVSLRASVRLVTERPLLAVASHSHFDHIGNHHEFPDRAIHRAEAEILTHPDDRATLAADYARDDIFDVLPPGWDPAAYAVVPAPPTLLLDEGDVIDLGDRRLMVLATPGHSPGGISLWEAATGTLFSGDTVYDGPLVSDTPGADMDAYVASMERLRELPVRVAHGGHFPSFDGERHRALIDAFLAAAFDGTAGLTPQVPSRPGP